MTKRLLIVVAALALGAAVLELIFGGHLWSEGRLGAAFRAATLAGTRVDLTEQARSAIPAATPSAAIEGLMAESGFDCRAYEQDDVGVCHREMPGIVCAETWYVEYRLGVRGGPAIIKASKSQACL